MNFEQLFYNKNKNKNKNKKLFDFELNNVEFFNIIIFQEIKLKTINTVYEDNSHKTLQHPSNVNKRLFFLIFTLIIFILVITINFNFDIFLSNSNYELNSKLNNFFLFIIDNDIRSLKKFYLINSSFNSNIVDLLSIYKYLK